jgi:phospholipid/cholesterol/gamma-HCH transport system permease protein
VGVTEATSDQGSLSSERQSDGTLTVRLAGPWLLKHGVPPSADLEQQLATQPPKQVVFDATALGAWDTGILTFVTRLGAICADQKIPTDRSGLPTGVQKLVALAEAVPEKSGARREEVDESLLERVGLATLSGRDAAVEMLGFIGQTAVAFGRALTFRARYRRSDLMEYIQDAGAEGLPIVSLISFLVGLILAFVGAVQLQSFGASIYVADLVGIAMVREMGAMMTAIVIAGRTGASYAAALGSQKATQEIDALTTMGISPMEFLVLPRMLALMLMMPLLCLYSDLMGILGGLVVGAGMLDISPVVYFQQTAKAVHLGDAFGGVFKASVYGVLIAVAGCLRGMQSGSSSSAVGEATTSAVVTSIVLIISACGIFAVLFYLMGW